MITSSLFLFVLAFLIVCFAIVKILYIAHKKHLFDEPSEDRKIHLTKTPNLGGLAIFTTLLFVAALFISGKSIAHINFLIAAATTLLALGLTDDLVGVDPMKKMAVQVFVALLTTTMADVRFGSLYGIFGVTAIPYWLSITTSAFFIIFMINAINLVDGINGLAGSIGLLSCFCFAWFFWKLNDPGFLYLAVALCGCLAGFLVYNITPAKIFMGDTGSLLLGFILSVFAIRFLELDMAAAAPVKHPSAPAIPFALFIIPIFDTVRVFAVRLINKKPPFAADRNHIHHLLLDLKLSHLQATGILITVNLSVILLVNLMGPIQTAYTLLAVISYTLSLYAVLWYLKSKLVVKQLNNSTPGKPTVELNGFTYNIINPGTPGVKKERNTLVEENSNLN